FLTQKNKNDHCFWFSNLSQLIQVKISQPGPENEKLKEIQAWMEGRFDKTQPLEEQIYAYWNGIIKGEIAGDLLQKPEGDIYQRLIKYDLSEFPPTLFEKVLNLDNNAIIECDLQKEIPKENAIEEKLRILDQWVKILDDIQQDN